MMVANLKQPERMFTLQHRPVFERGFGVLGSHQMIVGVTSIQRVGKAVEVESVDA